MPVPSGLAAAALAVAFTLTAAPAAVAAYPFEPSQAPDYSQPLEPAGQTESQAAPPPEQAAEPAREPREQAADPAQEAPGQPEVIRTGDDPIQPREGPVDTTDDFTVSEEPAEPAPLSEAAQQVARWVAAADDNGGKPFAVIDKVAAQVLIYDPDGQLRAEAPALLGLAPGDDSPPGIGTRKLSAITPDERITPAGRFMTAWGRAPGQQHVLWVDYATAISMHPVITTNPKEHRLERLQSPLAGDKRITYGCINVPTQFYREVVRPAFQGGGVVYILPETRPTDEVFPGLRERGEAGVAANREREKREDDDQIITLSHLGDSEAPPAPSAP